MVILLTKGALSVDFPKIKKFWSMVLPLAIGGCGTEAFVGIFVFRFVTGLPWPVAATLG